VKTLTYIIAASAMFQLGCEPNQKSSDYIEFLQDSGYKKLNCNLNYNEEVKSYDFFTDVVPKSDRKEMLLARCIPDSSCDFEIIVDNSTPVRILCQRFYDTDDFESEYDVDQIILTYNTEYFLDIKE
jgi:hypothetical protein